MLNLNHTACTFKSCCWEQESHFRLQTSQFLAFATVQSYEDGGRIVWIRNRTATDLEEATIDTTMDVPNYSKTPDLVSTTEVLQRAKTNATCEVKTT